MRKSKLSGLRQVYDTALGTYPRWQTFIPPSKPASSATGPRGAQLKTFTHYGDDEQNTPYAHQETGRPAI